jgi:plastocyanin
LVFFLITGTGCTSNTTAAATTADEGADSFAVTIQSNSYNPESLTIKVGNTITWTNNDSYAHTITSDNGAFESNNIVGGGTYGFTFKTVGTYSYHCRIHSVATGDVTCNFNKPVNCHSSMTAKIIVE